MKKIIMACLVFFSLIISNFSITKEQATTIFAHGFTGSANERYRFKEAFSSPENHNGINFPDTLPETELNFNRIIALVASYYKKRVHMSYAYMGQGKDIETMHEQFQKIASSDQPIILFGSCRGASAIINYLAQYNPENVKAIILDGGAANTIEALHPFMRKWGIPLNWDEPIFRTFFPAYPKDVITPLQAIKNIKNKELPILIIHAINDTTIPFIQALELFHEFKKQGFKHVHLARFPHGKHAFLLEHDKSAYLRIVHSFYKQYGFLYNEQYAQDIMDEYTPNIDHVGQEIAHHKKGLKNKSQA